ncbi:hypothetical protein D9M73_146100 [compost metagenome]
MAGLPQPAIRHPVRKPGQLARGVSALAAGAAIPVSGSRPDVVFRGFHRHRDYRGLGVVDSARLDRWRQRRDPRGGGVQLLRLDGRPGAADLPVLFLDGDVGGVRQPLSVSGAAQPA